MHSAKQQHLSLFTTTLLTCFYIRRSWEDWICEITFDFEGLSLVYDLIKDERLPENSLYSKTNVLSVFIFDKFSAQ